ncbi:MAG: bacteriophage holin [bacterium]
MKIDSIRLGVAVGIIWAGGVLFLGLLVSFFNWGTILMQSLASIYKGYGPSLGGIIIGTIWALIDGFCAGFFFGWVFNKLPKMGDI